MTYARSTADAFSDLVTELRSTSRPLEELATEIAGDYDVNPAFLIRKFHEQYPDGLPPVDVEQANRLQRAADEKQRQLFAAEQAAIVDFFAQNPTQLRRAPVAAQRIIAQCIAGEVLRGLVQAAIADWPCQYTTQDGEEVRGARLDEVQRGLVQLGVSGASRIDMNDIEQAGVRVVSAQYTGGVRPTGRFIRVAVLDR